MKNKRRIVVIIACAILILIIAGMAFLFKNLVHANLHMYIFITSILFVILIACNVNELITKFYTHGIQGDKLKIKLEQDVVKELGELNSDAERKI